jgi:hypothetical protein
MEDKMEYFIDQIGEIYDELHDEADKKKYNYFRNGGCYILAKLVKFYCPSVKIMHCIKDYTYRPKEEIMQCLIKYYYYPVDSKIGIERYNHAAVKYNNKLYDIFGEIPINYYDNYVEATDNDIIAMENSFSIGEGLGENKSYLELIKEINQCGFSNLINALN